MLCSVCNVLLCLRVCVQCLCEYVCKCLCKELFAVCVRVCVCERERERVAPFTVFVCVKGMVYSLCLFV